MYTNTEFSFTPNETAPRALSGQLPFPSCCLGGVTGGVLQGKALGDSWLHHVLNELFTSLCLCVPICATGVITVPASQDCE